MNLKSFIDTVKSWVLSCLPDLNQNTTKCDDDETNATPAVSGSSTTPTATELSSTSHQEQSRHHLAERRQVALIPGIYRRNGRQRILIGLFNGRCVYGVSFDPDGKTIAVTACSVRTFLNAVGETPDETFTEEQEQSLLENLRPMRATRRMNKWERNHLRERMTGGSARRLQQGVLDQEVR